MSFSIIIPIYNEETRIVELLNSINIHCEDIVIINKSSTDKSKEIINNQFPNVKVIDFPYAERGCDDFQLYCKYASYDWIFVCVASEIIPESFWSPFKSIFETNILSEKDLIMIPRLYYCFGSNVKGSPWDVSFFPFFFNKKRIVFSNKLHSHFNVSDESKRFTINLQREQMIVHKTHLSFDSFLSSSVNYANIENIKASASDVNSILHKYYYNICEGNLRLSKAEQSIATLEHYAAWNLYWCIHILKYCESIDTEIKTSSKNNFFKLSIKDKLVIRMKPRIQKVMSKSILLRKLVNKIKIYWDR